MERQLTNKWLLMNAAMCAVFAVFVLIPEVLFTKHNEIHDQQTNTTTISSPLNQPTATVPADNDDDDERMENRRHQFFRMLVVFAVMFALFFIALGIFFIMKRNEHLRRTPPWNAILTAIFYLLYSLGFACLSLILVQQREMDVWNGTNFLAAGFFTAWFASFAFVFKAIFCLLHCSNHIQVDSGISFGTGTIVFLITYIPLYLLLTLVLFDNVVSVAYWISFGFFILLGVFTVYLSLKMVARRVRKYVAKIDEKHTDACFYDLLYQWGW